MKLAIRSLTPDLSAAVKAAKRAKAPALEACPYETSQPVFVGVLSTFRRAGFKVVARPTPKRAIVRHDLDTVS